MATRDDAQCSTAAPEKTGDMREFETIAKQGVGKLKEYLAKRQDAWKDVSLNIAVTGISGVGKSTFINAVRSVKKGDEGYAKVGVTETTMDLVPYPHPRNKSLIFWDMPGVNTPKFPKESYLEDVHFEKYDFFLILSQKRFHNDDLWLAKEVKKTGKKFFFIRTQVGSDVDNDKKEDRENHSKKRVIEEIRDDCNQQLQGIGSDENVFLIDSYEVNDMDYDFNKLQLRLIEDIPTDLKKEAMIFSLTVLTSGVIRAKKEALEKRIWLVATLSAAGAAVPIPGVGEAVDIAIITREILHYRAQFGITKEDLKRLEQKFDKSKFVKDLVTRYAQTAMQMVAAVSADEALESAAKLAIPVIGSIISGVMSYGVTVAMLRRQLNMCADDALKLNEMYITETFV